MSTTEERSSDASGMASGGRVDAKLEVLVIPVSDVDRVREFYGRLGWRLDADRGGTEFRVIRFTPPGKRLGVADPGWPGWYAEHKMAERAGRELPT